MTMHDELLNGAVKYNELAGRMDVLKEMPWKRFTTSYSDNDLDNIQLCTEGLFRQCKSISNP